MFEADLVRAWNSHDGRQVAALYAEGGVRHQVALEEARYVGRDAVGAAAQDILDAWPDAVLEARTVVTQGNTVVVEWTFRGTHRRDYGPLPAHGEATELNGVSAFDLAEGLVTEERVYWDGATLMASAGLLG